GGADMCLLRGTFRHADAPSRSSILLQYRAPMSNSQQSRTEDNNLADSTKYIIAEYAALRSEIMTRTSNMYQLFGAGFATLLWVCTAAYSYSTLIVLFLGLLFFLGFSWLIDRDIQKAARRLREIERDVNDRTGEPLLVWESRWGG